MINNHSKNNHNNKNSQINKNNIPGRPAKSNVTAHNEHSVDTRELALEMLIEINERGAFSHIVLRSVLDKYQYLSKQDRAFMTRLVDGTIEYMLQLDYIIDSFSKTKVRKMKPFIRNLLRMSVYQIKYMDAVPDSAVCNEAVKLAKRHKFAQLSGFVNGVLRNIARNIDSVQFDTLSIRYSMPQWIVDRFVAAYGEKKAEEIFKAFHNKSTISIRTNLTRCTPDELRATLEAEGVTVTAVDELNYAFVISGFDYLNGLQSFRDGLFYVQDISSMLVAQTAAPKKGDYVIDVCAAPGGKSTHIAELLRGSGHVFARDLTDNKVDMIISCDYAGVGFGRAHVCIKVKGFAQCYVYAAEALADRGRNRPFQRNAVLADGINDMVGQGCAVFFDHGCACFHFIPFNGNAGCLYNALRCRNNLRAAAVPGDKSYFMCHIILPPLYSSADRLRAECRTVLRKYSVLWEFLRRYAPVLPLGFVPLLRL